MGNRHTMPGDSNQRSAMSFTTPCDDDFEREAAAVERFWMASEVAQESLDQRLAALQPLVAAWRSRGEPRLIALASAFGYMLSALDRRGHGRSPDPARLAQMREEVRSIGWPRAERLAEIGDTAESLDPTSLRASRDILLGHGPREADSRPAAERFWTELRLCVICAQLGDFEGALVATVGCLELARHSGLENLIRQATHIGINVSLSAGDVQGAQALLESADHHFHEALTKNHSLQYNALLTFVLGERFDRADDLLAGATPAIRDLPPDGLRPAVAYVHARQGRLQDALALLSATDLSLDANKHGPQLLANRTWLTARTWLLAGEPQRAADLLNRLIEMAATQDWQLSSMNRTQLYQALADALEALGDLRGAMSALRQSQAACVSWVASSMRSRLLALHGGQPLQGEARMTRRLEALDNAVTQAVVPLEPQPVHAPPFIAHVTHEIRNSVNGLIGMTSLLALSKLDARQQHLVSLAQDSGQMLVALCNDLLDLAKIEAGRFELSPEPTDVATLAQRMAEQFRDRTAPGVTLACQVAGNLPARLQVDPLRLRQLIMNLLGNAIKFTTQGQVTLAVDWLGAPAPAGRLRVAVADTGPGMSAQQRVHLFEEFYQVQGAKDALRGTGLGLALCRALVQRMNGRIDVDSEPGRGSRFWFELPLSVAETPIVGSQETLS